MRPATNPVSSWSSPAATDSGGASFWSSQEP